MAFFLESAVVVLPVAVVATAFCLEVVAVAEAPVFCCLEGVVALVKVLVAVFCLEGAAAPLDVTFFLRQSLADSPLLEHPPVVLRWWGDFKLNDAN